MALSLPLGAFWSLLILALLAVGLPLAITWVGLPILGLAMLACLAGARLERWRLAKLLGVRLPPPYRRLAQEASLLSRAGAIARDRAFWRALAYLLLLLPVGLAEFVSFLAAFVLPLPLITHPLWFWAFPKGFFQLGANEWIDTVPEALLVALIGLALGSSGLFLVRVSAAAHERLGRVLLGPGRRNKLTERVEELTESRTRAVEAAIVERRRIERDLHDGAQQRLVSLAMNLGLAREKLKRKETETAVALVEEAHEEAKRALAEIRDLVRGIHPAILTDRGLDAALSALAGRSPVPVAVDVRLDERPPEGIETTAYFVVAETLVNVAKHANASEARILVRHERGGPLGEGDRLAVEIEDDGDGGASPRSGTGLAGLADRVAALDGSLHIQSPEGGPTLLRAELPWEKR